ncbi:MAG: bifunctional metallophosphatase/5'-nucleotidase [Eubacteriaceae bacterium]|nr:bifunctional metallophosphatase/5'-nucleotidase [Eubacteriaceae bacterium]
MKLRKSLVALLLAVMLMVAPFTAFAGEVTKTDDIVILYTNDVHCEADGYAQIAALKKQMAEENAAAYLVDSGDYIQGGTLGTLTKGEALVEIMNAAGYDFTTLGNHEFDYGMDQLMYLMNDVATFKVLSANFDSLETGKAVFDDYEIVEAAGKKIAFVGVTTPESFTKSTPTYFQNDKGEYIYSFASENLAEDVQKSVDAAKAEGADFVIILGHLGIEGTTDGWKSSDLIPQLKNVDAVLDAHAHQIIKGDTYKDADGKEVVLTSTGTKIANVGKLTIKADGTITTELIKAEDLPAADSAVKAVIDAENEAFEAILNQVVATTEVVLTIKDENGNRLVRKDDTNLGNLCADAYRNLLGADVAFVNGGGVRADIDAGDITYAEIIAVHPFGNEACLVEATGLEIWQALEMGYRLLPSENGGFLQVSGLTCKVNTAIPSGVEIDSTDSSFVKVTYEYGKNSRVQDIEIGGKAIDLDKTYLLASHNYMLKSGGDGFSMFPDNKLLKDGVLIDNRVLIDYIVGSLEGKVTAEAYGKAENRVNIVNEEIVVPEVPVEPEKPEHDNPPTGDNAFVFAMFAIAAISTVVVIDRKRKAA